MAAFGKAARQLLRLRAATKWEAVAFGWQLLSCTVYSKPSKVAFPLFAGAAFKQCSPPLARFAIALADFSHRRQHSSPVSPVAAAGRPPPTPARSMSASAGNTASLTSEGDVVVQYVVLRRDLIDAWPLSSIVAQGCHASVAAVWSHRHHTDVLTYCSDHNLDAMHKVILEVKGETQLRNLSEKLTAEGIEHKLWVEQPESFPTCLATRPYPKSQVASSFKKLKLCK